MRTGRKQKKYEEAETVVGQEHANIINARYMTTRSLYNQKKDKEAEIAFRQVVQKQETARGRGHADTINARY